MPRRRHAYAIACPKLPALAVRSSVPGEILDARYSAPRPLKDRIGLAVSTLTRIFVPSKRDNESARNCGVRRNTGSIDPTDSRIPAIFKRCSIRLCDSLAGCTHDDCDGAERACDPCALHKTEPLAQKHPGEDHGGRRIK